MMKIESQLLKYFIAFCLENDEKLCLHVELIVTILFFLLLITSKDVFYQQVRPFGLNKFIFMEL